jgi:hypothetical protein
MRNCIAAMYVSKYLYSERGYCEKKKRQLERVCCRLYPFILLDNNKGMT